MKKVLFTFLLLAIGFVAVQAQRAVTGKVLDEDNQPLVGASVLIKGTSLGTVTDENGDFSLNLNPGNEVLVLSYTGYVSQEIDMTGMSSISISFSPDSRVLDEYVIVGYGVQKKRDVTGSISQVKGETLANLNSPSFAQQLAGRAAGVQVQNTSGILGSAPIFRIRGVNSISSGTQPLFVIDGVPVVSGDIGGFTPTNALGDINPNDIESYEILKDGAATAIYGSRAANGVVLITTKKGKKGKATFSYDANIGVAKSVKLFDLLGAQDFVTISNEKYTNAGAAPVANLQTINGQTVETDWQDLVFQSALQQSHSFSVSGGTDYTNYYFSFGLSDQEGIVRSNTLNRYSFRANIDQKVNNWLTTGVVAGVTRQNNAGPLTGSNNLSGNVFGTIRMLPNVAALDPTDPTGYNIDDDNERSLGRGANTDVISNGIPNQLFVLDNDKRTNGSWRLLGNAFVQLKLTKDLNFKSQIGIDGSYVDDYLFQDPRHGDGFSANGRISQAYSPLTRWNWQNILSYGTTFNDAHNLDVVLVQEYQKQRSSFFQATVADISDLYFQTNIVSGTFSTPTIAGGISENGIASYLGRFNYNFKSKYYISASLRRDAISSLPEANRVGYFPGVSFAYRVSEEGFWDGIRGTVSDFRVRGSWAQTGNTNIGNYPYIGSFGSALYGTQNGIAYNNFGNDGLKWESQEKLDFGFDAGLFNDRVTLSFAYWQQDNQDIILQKPTPPSLGIPGNFVNQNIGRVENNGIELSIDANVLNSGNFKWVTGFNITTQKNKVATLVEGSDIVTNYNIIREGESINSIYGYIYRGVNAANGNPMYESYNRDEDGNITETIVVQQNITNGQYNVYNEENPGELGAVRTLNGSRDRVILGSALPTVFGGFNNDFYYGGFDLNIFVRFSAGNYIMNRTRAELLNQGFNNNSTEILGRWQNAENPGDGQTPRMWLGRDAQVNNPDFASTRFVEKGDFIKVGNLSLGYTLPTHIVNKISVSKLRLYVQAQNILTFTKYSGLDPETTSNFSIANGFGEDFNGNPQQRVILGGINLTF